MNLVLKFLQLKKIITDLFQHHLLDLFLYSVPVAYTALLIEQIRSFGFLSRHTSSISLILIFSILTGILVWQNQELKKSQRLSQLYSNIRYLAAALLFVVILIGSVLLQRVGFLSQNEINIPIFCLTLIYTFILLVLPYLSNYAVIKTLPQGIVIAVFLFLLSSQYSPYFELLIIRTTRARLLIAQSYDQRMESLWGFIVPYFAFVREHTTADAVILHPPQKYPWPETGNQFIVRRFLYPRTLVAPEWGKGEYEWALIEDGSHYIHTVGNNMAGWPTIIIPTEKVILYEPRIREVQVTALRVGTTEWSLLPQASQSASTKIKALLQNNQLSLVATSSTIESDILWLGSNYQLSRDIPIELQLESTSSFSARLAIEFKDSQGLTQILYSATNETFKQLEFVTLGNAFTRIREFEKRNGNTEQATYALKFGIDLGAPRAMAYLEGNGLLKVDNQSSDALASCSGRSCLTLVEHLLKEQRHQDAYATLMKIEPLISDDPYFNFLYYLTLKHLDVNPIQQNQLLEKSGRYWATEVYYNLPRSIIRDQTDR